MLACLLKKPISYFSDEITQQNQQPWLNDIEVPAQARAHPGQPQMLQTPHKHERKSAALKTST